MSSEQEIVPDTQACLFEALRDASAIDLDAIDLDAPANNWTLAPDALRFIIALVSRLAPRHVVEFGSGLSTRALAAACSKLRHECTITSIDHDPEFGAPALAAALEVAGAGCTIRLQIAHLVAREMAGIIVPIYHLDPMTASDLSADLIIVDGPPEALGGRAGTLFQAMDFARPGTIVLFDDALRAAEQRAFELWREAFGDAIEIIPLSGFRKGMTAVIVRQPVRAGELWSHRHRALWRDLEGVIPDGLSCILVDDNQLHPTPFCNRRMLPFIERNGVYWGAPENDAHATAELARMRDEGARFLALARPAFWWMDHYRGFLDHLQLSYPRVLANEHAVVFDLREAGE